MCNTKEILECARARSYKYLLQRFCIHIILVGLFFTVWHRLRHSAAKSFQRVLIKFREKWKFTNYLTVHILGSGSPARKSLVWMLCVQNLSVWNFICLDCLMLERSNMFENLKTKYNLKYKYYNFNWIIKIKVGIIIKMKNICYFKNLNYMRFLVGTREHYN